MLPCAWSDSLELCCVDGCQVRPKVLLDPPKCNVKASSVTLLVTNPSNDNTIPKPKFGICHKHKAGFYEVVELALARSVKNSAPRLDR